MDEITVKRKTFEIISPMGDRSYKVKRKEKTFFLKNFGNKEEFDSFIRNARRLSNTAIDTPKIILSDKKTFRVVMEYIEGTYMLDMLIDGDLDEKFYEMIFDIDWYARNDDIILDFRPDQFKYDGKRMYYLPFRFKKFEKKENFTEHYIKYWFYTNELVQYLKDLDLPYDEKRIGNVFAKNKQMALIAVKYYR